MRTPRVLYITMNVKKVLIISVIVFVSLVVALYIFLSRSNFTETSFIADHIELISKNSFGSTTIEIYLRTTGWADKVDFIEAYRGPVIFDQYGKSENQPIVFEVVDYKLDENLRYLNTVEKIVFDETTGIIKILFNDGSAQSVKVELGI